VFRVAGAPETREQAWLAGALAAGDDHFLSYLTGSAVWELKGFPEPESIHLLTTSESRSRQPGLTVHRTRHLPSSHVTTRWRMPVTTVARTLIDSCAAVPFKVLKSAANDAIRRKQLTVVEFARCLDETPTSGRRASRPARQLASILVPGYNPGDSEPELDIVEILVRAGYPPPDQQIRVPCDRGKKYRVDVGYADIKQGWEFQSESFHVGPLHDDSERTCLLQRAGWQIWPVTSRTARAEILAIAAHAFGHLRAA
jgi:hypothetical protein